MYSCSDTINISDFDNKLSFDVVEGSPYVLDTEKDICQIGLDLHEEASNEPLISGEL